MTTNQPVFKRLANWLTMGACAALLAACGGGGGSPGATGGNGGTVGSKAAALVLTASAASMSADAGVTLTVVVKDSGNNALSGETVSFKSSAGSVSSTKRVTDSTGTVTETLSITPDVTGTVTVTASAGSATSNQVSINVIAAKPSVVISTLSDALQSAAGSSMTVTVVAKGGNNVVLVGADVTLTSSSGELVFGTHKTDANGMVTATLSSLDPTPRPITLTASVAGATPVTKIVNVVNATPTMLLTSNSGTLESSGAPGKEVVVQALIKDANNAIVSGAKVNFTSDSGALSSNQATTDANGIAKVTLGTGSDPSSRTIIVTATSAGAKMSTLQITVTGTRLVINSSSTVNKGSSTDVTVTLLDSANAPLANRDISFGAVVNPISITGSTSTSHVARTNSAGQVILRYSAVNGASDIINVSALGASATKTININTANFVANVTQIGGTFLPVGGEPDFLPQGSINTCYQVRVHNDADGVPQTGNVTVSASRGTIYSDSLCSVALLASTPLDASGNAVAYIKATGPGVATVTVTSTSTTTSVLGFVEFTAPLTATSVITVQADPAVVAIGQQTTLRAIVADKLAQGNLVKNAKVAFSILTDPSGGHLTQPSEVLTDANGVATVSYVAGASATALDGVRVQAQLISGVTAASTTTNLTVAQKALFISAGTGATVLTPSSSTYQIDYSVFVTDAAGNAVPGVTITGSVKPRGYRKGSMTYIGIDGPWQPATLVAGVATPGYAATCANEDIDSDGVLSAGEDTNNNGRLDPLIPITITSSGKTDSNGIAVLSMVYPRDRAYWVDVDFVIRGTVSGTEARYVGYALLPGIGTDYGNKAVAPPGRFSPYGVSTSCTDTL